MEEVRRMRPLLGTFVEVCARGPAAGAAVDAALLSIERSQRRWSRQDEGSELSTLNRSAGEPVALSLATLRLLRLARALRRHSGGAFDCTLGTGETANALEIGPGWARLRAPARITLDGIAKGFAVDRAIGAMRRTDAALAGGWINAGGDLRVFGDRALPVHRREIDGRLTPLGLLRDAAMATSAVYPAGAVRDRRFPADIVAPPGRQPSPGAWTVLARSACRADALTKVAATAEPAGRAALVAALGGHLLQPEEAA